MCDAIRRNLAFLTLLAALVGALSSSLFRDRVSHSKESMSGDDLLREVETGTKMPVIAASGRLTRFAGAMAGRDVSIELEPGEHAQVFIPDKYAMAALRCDTREPEFIRLIADHGGVWFQGAVSATRTVIESDARRTRGTIAFQGSVYRCRDGKTMQAASGITLTLPLDQVGASAIPVRTSSAWTSYPAAAAQVFITFLLMIFVPTLTLSIIKAIVDSAQPNSSSAGLFQYSFRYFGITTLIAGMIGISAGYVCYSVQPHSDSLRDVAAVSIDGDLTPTPYDAHPILTQLVGIIPTNPFSALSNPDGNKGLQVAFTAVIVGILLAVIGPTYRERASQFLKRSLALVVKDTDLKWRALSDWADILTPLGVFFMSLSFCASVSYDFLRQMLVVILCILGALILHAVILTIWIVRWRDSRDWFRRGLFPGTPGLITALATSSSYAALPGIAAVPLLGGDSSRRGIFDFCTTINKNGTTIYIATVASYALFAFSGGVRTSVLVVLLLSGLASVATAGLPFAAVFGLRMLLLASGSPGGLAWAIIPIDPLVDRFVTVLNVFANLAACSQKKPVRTGGFIDQTLRPERRAEAAHA
jgi:Na+/H+-dicarboxylate symporter